MNKKELKQIRLQKHYEALNKLSILTGGKVTDGKKLSCKLLKIEKEVYKYILSYSNGDTEDIYEELNKARTEVLTLFPKLRYFFINTDPRGYSLKINLDKATEDYKNIGLQRDWGGYGLLAPVIDGN